MAKVEVVMPATPAPVGRERLSDVRLRVGEVHWNGARPVTHLTTDKNKTTVFSNHVLVADEMSLHPAGVLLRIEEESWVIPHARVEAYKLA